MRYIFLGLIKLYQFTVSPLLGECCRFHPHCSEYAIEAVKKHRCGYAIWLILKRLIKCHPWHPGGHDPVP